MTVLQKNQVLRLVHLLPDIHKNGKSNQKKGKQIIKVQINKPIVSNEIIEIAVLLHFQICFI